jgi:hypothetical protein
VQTDVVIMRQADNRLGGDIERRNPRRRLSSTLSRREERAGQRIAAGDAGSDLATAAILGRCHNLEIPEL